MIKMIKMIKYILLGVLAVILSACSSGGSAAPPAPLPDMVEMFFIYEESCGSCDGTAEFYEITSAHLSDVLDLYPNQIHTINTFSTGNRARFEALAQDLLNVNASALSLPLLIVNGIAYQGMDAIGANIREAFLTAGHDLFVNKYVFNPRYMRTGSELFAGFDVNPNHLTLVYFYRMVCPACMELEPILAALPKTVDIDGRQVPVDLIRINTRSGNNRERVMAFFEYFEVPDHLQSVPIMFTASGYYTGTEAIADMILHNLGHSEQVGLRMP